MSACALNKGFPLNLVVARCPSGGIGINGNLPWKLKGDMAFFKRITMETKDANKQNVVIMGRRTWDSIPAKFRPLPNRINVVLSKTLKEAPAGASLASSLDAALDLLAKPPLAEKVEGVFIIGGHSVYKEALESTDCHRVYLTEVLKEFECDTFLPEIDVEKFQLVSDPTVPSGVQTENEIDYRFDVWEERD
ncbi:dihydrofolate reductase-like [Lineus longissimus]|uniref:dihydrofolate reductase-like n=1 Tax=Lineus longissimus TaxID=88925 RepID=UPI002B4D19B0